jgi:hypothetical protein
VNAATGEEAWRQRAGPQNAPQSSIAATVAQLRGCAPLGQALLGSVLGTYCSLGNFEILSVPIVTLTRPPLQLQLNWKGDGPLGGILVTGDHTGQVCACLSVCRSVCRAVRLLGCLSVCLTTMWQQPADVTRSQRQQHMLIGSFDLHISAPSVPLQGVEGVSVGCIPLAFYTQLLLTIHFHGRLSRNRVNFQNLGCIISKHMPVRPCSPAATSCTVSLSGCAAGTRPVQHIAFGLYLAQEATSPCCRSHRLHWWRSSGSML